MYFSRAMFLDISKFKIRGLQFTEFPACMLYRILYKLDSTSVLVLRKWLPLKVFNLKLFQALKKTKLQSQ